MKKLIFLLLVSILFFSCQTEPEPVQVNAEPAAAEELPAPVVEPVAKAEVIGETFDPQNVSQELFDTTLEEVQGFIGALNAIIRAQRYDEWEKNLSQEYIDTYSSPEYLKQASEDPRFKAQKVILNNLRDYFVYNVVPSRANVDTNVDDIEFITPVRVKAYTLNARGQRLRLYELEKEGNDWKIIN